MGLSARGGGTATVGGRKSKERANDTSYLFFGGAAIKDHPTQVFLAAATTCRAHGAGGGDVSSLLFLNLPAFGRMGNADAALSCGTSHLPGSFSHLLVTSSAR